MYKILVACFTLGRATAGLPRAEGLGCTHVATQWAAVSTHLGWTREPPQKTFRSMYMAAWKGNCVLAATSPLKMRRP